MYWASTYWATGRAYQWSLKHLGATRQKSTTGHRAGSAPEAADQNERKYWTQTYWWWGNRFGNPLARWQFLGTNEKRAPAWYGGERGAAGVGWCEGPPSAWCFGTSLPTAWSINIATWGGQACLVPGEGLVPSWHLTLPVSKQVSEDSWAQASTQWSCQWLSRSATIF